MACSSILASRKDRSNNPFLNPMPDIISPTEGSSGVMEENMSDPIARQPAASRWRRVFGGKSKEEPESSEDQTYRAKSTLGILSDRETDEVPGE